MDALGMAVAAGVIKEGSNTISSMVNDLIDYRHNNSVSLTQLAKRTMVSSVVYVEDTLVQEDITIPLMGALNSIYIGYVLTALGLYNSIDRWDYLGDIIKRITNEDLVIPEVLDTESIINSEFAKVEVSTEAHDATKIFTIEDAVKHLVVGRLIEFDFNIAKETDADKTKSGTVTVPIYVQLRPVNMASEVAEAIISLNFPVKLKRRWKQVKMGEIRFFRDFVLANDLITKHNDALKADTSNVLSKFYKEKSKAQARRAVSLAKKQKKNNLASSMLIFTKDTFTKACASASIDFTKAIDRQRFFDESYAMIVVIVDQMYDIVDIYYNGIANGSEVPFKAIKQGGGNSGVDLSELMKAIAKGAPPKF